MTDIASALNILSQTMQRNTEEYSEQAEEFRRLYSGRAGRAGREQRQVDRKKEIDAVQRSTGALDSLFKSLRQVTAEQKVHGRVQRETLEGLQNSAGDVELLLGRKLPNSLLQTLQRIQLGGHVTDEALADLAEETAGLAKEEEQLLRQTIKAAHAQDKFNRRLDKLSDSAKKAADTFFSASVSIGLLGTGIARTFDELEFALKHQTEMFTMLSAEGTTWAGTLGLAPLEMQQLVAKYRPLIHSAAEGYKEAGQAINMSVTEMTKERKGRAALYQQAYDLTGNFNDASNMMMGTMNLLQKMGIQQTFGELGSQTETIMQRFGELAKVTGQSTDALYQQVGQYFNSAEARSELMKMDKQQRKQRVLEVLSNMEHQVALGKTTEAALDAQQALSRIAGMDPKERMKEAARMQAVMGAIGVEGGGRAAELFRKPVRSAKEEQELRGMMDEMGRAVQSGLAAGGGQAMVTGALFGKLSGDTQDIIMKQNTQLDQGFALSQEQMELLKQHQPNLSKSEEWLRNIKEMYEKNIETILKDPGAQLIAGLISGVGAIIKEIAIGIAGIWVLSKLGIPSLAGKLLGGLSTLGTTLISGIGTMLSGGATAAAGAVGGLKALATGSAGMVALSGAAGYAIGTGIDKGMEHLAPEFHKEMQEVVGGTLAQIIDKPFSQVMGDTMDFWTDFMKGEHSMRDKHLKQTNTLLEQSLEVQKEQKVAQEQTAKATTETKQAVVEGAQEQVGATEQLTEKTEKGRRQFAIKAMKRAQ